MPVILRDPTAQEFATWLVGSPESQIVAGIVGFGLGLVVFGLLALILAR